MTTSLSRRDSLALFASSAMFVACQREPLPALGKVGAFKLVDHESRPTTAETLRGRVWVAAFMFTRCPTVCPALTRKMKDLQRAAQAEEVPLVLVSFSVDAEHDTPEVLGRYAREQGVSLNNWFFLTGDSHTIKQLSVRDFKLALEGKPDQSSQHYGMVHGSRLVLVDPALQIRGYYDTSSDKEALNKLLDDAKTLVA
jgi:protein SCO1/2